jgi:uncharacterized membrane protein YqjE
MPASPPKPSEPSESHMNTLRWLFVIVHAVIALLFGVMALALLWLAAAKAWSVIRSGLSADSTLPIFEALGILAGAVVALQISQTVAEEEVIREAQISGPTRVRRFLSRFLVVVVVALSIEALISTFKAQEEPHQLLYTAALLFAVASLLAGWGVFVHLNRSAEELEPEAMEEAKDEDHKVS